MLTFPETLFYEILSEKVGMPIGNDGDLMKLLTELVGVKKEYDKISDALASVKATGYGIVNPAAEEITLQTPEIVKKGGAFVAMKGPGGETELADAQKAIRTLGGKAEETHLHTLDDGSSRTIIVIRKIAPTPPAYPRAGGKIAKSPL
jgi:hypothetical protein